MTTTMTTTTMTTDADVLLPQLQLRQPRHRHLGQHPSRQHRTLRQHHILCQHPR